MGRRYLLTCTALGLILGWVPMFLHGPIPEKFNAHYIRGDIAVWGFYVARCLIGFLVGITRWPPRWYVRGPLCGILMVLPLTFISLSMQECGFPCMRWNLTSAAVIGLIIARCGELVRDRSAA